MTTPAKIAKARPAKRFTLRKAADYLRVSVAVVNRLAENGSLMGLRLGKNRSWFCYQSDLDAWLEKQGIARLIFQHRSRL